MANQENANAGADMPPPTRDRILAAARTLFAARGFKGTTTAEIARQARVNEALIYRHFPDKEDLYRAILQNKLADESLERILRAAECRQAPVEEALRLVAQRFGESVDPEFLRLYYHSALEGHDLAGVFYDQFIRRLMALVEELIERGVREGRFRAVHPALAAEAFTGMLRSHYLTRELFPVHGAVHDSRLMGDAFCDLFLRGILAVHDP